MANTSVGICKRYAPVHQISEMLNNMGNSTLSRNAETKDFARPTSHPVRGWTGKNRAFCSPRTQNGRRVIKVYRANQLLTN